MTLPNFLVIGAPRCGTTWLHGILGTHRDVFVPRFRKELHFFDQNWHRGVEWYETFFEEAGSASAVGETTPSYLSHREAPERIASALPDCRFIAILRNPIDRAFSHYGHMVMTTGERMDFEEALRNNPGILDIGRYSCYLERYLGLFDDRQLLVLIFERATSELETTFQKIGSFLGVPEDGFDLDPTPQNETSVPRFGVAFSLARGVGRFLRTMGLDRAVEIAKNLGVQRIFGTADPPELSRAMRTRLAKLYEADIQRVETLLGTQLVEWR